MLQSPGMWGRTRESASALSTGAQRQQIILVGGEGLDVTLWCAVPRYGGGPVGASLSPTTSQGKQISLPDILAEDYQPASGSVAGRNSAATLRCRNEEKANI